VLDGSDIHIHVPTGATPKDGPSAGVAMIAGDLSEALDVHRYEIGEGEASFSLVCGCFHAVYGPGLDLFASLASPVVETFDAYDQLDRLMSYAMVELAAREIGGDPMASALFKLMLLALLRRSLTSANAGWSTFRV
jgi:AraC family transcriptional activator of mtrCDE